MFNIQTWDIWLILTMQNLNEWLQPVMKLFTWMGYPQAYLLLIVLVYWTIDSRLGIRMAIFLGVGACINSLLKMVIHSPRPFWVNSQIEAIHPANGFGMPSGHAQSATVWLLISVYLKKKWFWMLAVTIAFMIGLSRAYLGVHFPSQIIIGWLLGTGIIVCFIKFELRVINWFQKKRTAYQLLLVAGMSLMFILAGLLVKFGMENWTMPLEWISNASVYMPLEGSGLLSYSIISLLGNAGGFLGAATGSILIIRSGGFSSAGIWWKRLLRCIIGLIILAALYIALTYVSPDENNTLLFGIWRSWSFFIILFSGIYLLPVLFARMNLGNLKIDPVEKV